MLPFLAGMFAPSLLGAGGALAGLGLAGLPAWALSGIGGLVGGALQGDGLDPMNALAGAGGGLLGGTGSLLGSTTAGAAGAAVPAAEAGAAGVAEAAAAEGAKSGLMSMLTPGNVMMGATLLGGMGGGNTGSAPQKEKQWRPQAQAPNAPTASTVPAGYVPGISPEHDYGVGHNVARDNMLRDLSGYAEGGEVSPVLSSFSTDRNWADRTATTAPQTQTGSSFLDALRGTTGEGGGGLLSLVSALSRQQNGYATPDQTGGSNVSSFFRPSAGVTGAFPTKSSQAGWAGGRSPNPRVDPPVTPPAPPPMPDPMTQYLSRPATAPQQIGQASQSARDLQAQYMSGEGPRGIRRQGITSLTPQTIDISPIENPYSDYLKGGSTDIYGRSTQEDFKTKLLGGLFGAMRGGGSGGSSTNTYSGSGREAYDDRSRGSYGSFDNSRETAAVGATGGLYAEGGEVETGGIDPKMPEVQNAIAAIMGDPNVDPQQAMGALFLKLKEKYGEEQAAKMIRDLVGQVQGGGAAPSRQIPEAGGPDGMADDQMAMIDGQEPARINSGELVVSKPDLAAIGNGDDDKGLSKLENLLAQVRKEHYGREEHPDRVNFEQMASRMV